MVVETQANWSNWKSYRPFSMRTYGAICISPAKRFLLVQGAKTGIWSFPKGHLKSGELGQECALRELREETGIALRPYAFSRVLKLFAGEYFCYEMMELPAEPQNSAEICATGWFSLEEMMQMEVNADIKRFLTLQRRTM